MWNWVAGRVTERMFGINRVARESTLFWFITAWQLTQGICLLSLFDQSEQHQFFTLFYLFRIHRIEKKKFYVYQNAATVKRGRQENLQTAVSDNNIPFYLFSSICQASIHFILNHLSFFLGIMCSKILLSIITLRFVG